MKNLKDMIHMAKLAKLSLEEEELHSLTRDMEEIIGLMDTLRDIDTDGIDAREHILNAANNTRADVPSIPLSNDNILSNAGHVIDHCFAIPKVIEG